MQSNWITKKEVVVNLLIWAAAITFKAVLGADQRVAELLTFVALVTGNVLLVGRQPPPSDFKGGRIKGIILLIGSLLFLLYGAAGASLAGLTLGGSTDAGWWAAFVSILWLFVAPGFLRRGIWTLKTSVGKPRTGAPG